MNRLLSAALVTLGVGIVTFANFQAARAQVNRSPIMRPVMGHSGLTTPSGRFTIAGGTPLVLASATSEFPVPSISNSNFTIAPGDGFTISYDSGSNSYYREVQITTINTNATYGGGFNIVATNNGSVTGVVFLGTSVEAYGMCDPSSKNAGADSDISFLGGSTSGDCSLPDSTGYGNSGSGYQGSPTVPAGDTFTFDGTWDGAAAAYNY